MKPTQGVILIMIAALLLFLTWSSRSILQGKPKTPTVGNTDPNISGTKCPDGTTEHFVGATRFCLPNSHGVLSSTNDGLVRV